MLPPPPVAVPSAGLSPLDRFAASPQPHLHPVAYRLFHGAVPPTLSVRDQIAVHTAERIVLRRLPPGERVKEPALAEEFGVSKAPVGEALLLLERFGLVECVAHRGVFVTPVSAADFDDLLAYRTALANAFVPRYARTHTEQDQAVLQRYLAQLTELVGDDSRSFDFIEITDRCFLFLAARAGSVRIAQAMTLSSLQALRYFVPEGRNVRDRRRLLAGWSEAARILARRDEAQALAHLVNSNRMRTAAIQASLQEAA